MSGPGGERMLENPVLSRQWVLRRLQRALTAELAAAALIAGIARGSGLDALGDSAAAAAARARTLEELIRTHGSVPYGSVGLARAFARAGGWLLGIAGAWAWRRALLPVATHMLAEYDLLVAFVDGAPGVDPDLAEAVRPLLASARAQHEALREGRV